MSLPCLDQMRWAVAGSLLLTLLLAGPLAQAQQLPPALRVCADPDSLPYSSQQQGGFEPAIARILADELHLPLQITWVPLQRGFVRKTAGQCEVFISIPAGFERLATTRPYYRSTYVMVGPHVSDLRFDCESLCSKRIGVQLPGDDLAATPPGHALAGIGAVNKVRGYPVMGVGHASELMLDDVRAQRLDLAIAWGPQAGWFAAREPQLQLVTAKPPPGLPVPFEFDMAIGVRRGNPALLQALDQALQKRRDEIATVLAAWHVPRTDTSDAGVRR